MIVSALFEIEYGQSLSLNKLTEVPSGAGIAFVSRTARNNGISAWVAPVAGVEPLPAGLMTVCLRSRNYALSTFLQPRSFYCGYHIYVLRPRRPMADTEKLWWAQCISANRYRYNFGRQANRTLANLELPEKPPSWVGEADVPEFVTTSSVTSVPTLDKEDWTSFRLGELFELRRGRHLLKRDRKPGRTAFVGASAVNNGVTAWIDAEPDYPGGQITLTNNGSVGEAFYQSRPFIASGDVTVLLARDRMPEAAALFVCTVLYHEKFRWNYGRKWGYRRMVDSVIRLPSTPAGQPDWDRCSSYMASLPLASAVL